MTVAQLMAALSKFDPSTEVAILDSFNGAGVPRTINFGPLRYAGVAEYSGDERADYSDIKSPSGTPIVVMGYGCY